MSESLAVHRAGGQRLLEHASPAWLLAVAVGLVLLTVSLVLIYAWWHFGLSGDTLTYYLHAVPIVSAVGVVLVVLPRRGERGPVLQTLRGLILVAASGSLLYLIRYVGGTGPTTISALTKASIWSASAGTVLLFAYLIPHSLRIPGWSYLVQSIVLLGLSAATLLGPLRMSYRFPTTMFTTQPSLIGVGEASRPPYFVTMLLSRFYFRDPPGFPLVPSAIAGGIAAIWAAGFHASLAYTLLRLRRRALRARSGWNENR